MTTVRRIGVRMLLAAAVAAGGGCVEKPAAQADRDKTADASATTDAVTGKPNPTGAEHDPRVIAAEQSVAVMDAALRTFQERLDRIRLAFDARPDTTEAAGKTATALKPVAEEARDTCDAILCRAEDLEGELKLAGRGYEALADRYRDRAALLQEPDLRAIELGWAALFDRLAQDTPRRRRAVREFIDLMGENRRSLREAAACLGDVAAATAVLRAGPDEPLAVSRPAAAFRSRMLAFMRAVEEFQKALKTPPPQPAGETPPAKAPPASPTESKPASPSPTSPPSSPLPSGSTGSASPAPTPVPVTAPTGLFSPPPEVVRTRPPTVTVSSSLDPPMPAAGQ